MASPPYRRAALSPVQEEEFDRDDPWVAGVVFAWVPFDAAEPDQPGIDGKVRPCVVVAGSPTHLLVRAGYSEGGVKSRDWKSVALRHWRPAGFDQPTWIDIEACWPFPGTTSSYLGAGSTRTTGTPSGSGSVTRVAKADCRTRARPRVHCTMQPSTVEACGARASKR